MAAATVRLIIWFIPLMTPVAPPVSAIIWQTERSIQLVGGDHATQLLLLIYFLTLPHPLLTPTMNGTMNRSIAVDPG